MNGHTPVQAVINGVPKPDKQEEPPTKPHNTTALQTETRAARLLVAARRSDCANSKSSTLGLSVVR